MAQQRPARKAPAQATAGTAKRPWWLIAVGLAAAVLIAVATLPATLFASHLRRLGLEATAFTGSIWSGQAQALSWQSAPLGDLRWSIEALQLLRGRLGGNVELTRPDGSAASHFSVSLDRVVRLTDATVNLPIGPLSALPIGLPRNWRGRASGRFEEIVLSSGWPTALRGELDMDGLIAPPPRSTSIGSYHIEMPDPQATGGKAGDLTARVRDKEGPFSFEGRFTLAPDRSFLLDGSLAPRGNTPTPLLRSLELLGPPDASGRRPVSVSGTL